MRPDPDSHNPAQLRADADTLERVAAIYTADGHYGAAAKARERAAAKRLAAAQSPGADGQVVDLLAEGTDL